MCPQMNMKIHIHRQVKCLRNWGKIIIGSVAENDNKTYEEIFNVRAHKFSPDHMIEDADDVRLALADII